MEEPTSAVQPLTQVEETTAVITEPQATVKKKSGCGCLFRLFIFIVVASLIGVVSFLVINFINTSSRIIDQTPNSSCIDAKYCIQMDGIYANGWATWKATESLPPFFSMTASGFEKNQNVKITCPTNLEQKDDSIITKLKFIFNNPDIQKCRVNL